MTPDVNGEPRRELTFPGIIRLLRTEDIPQLKPILETWIRDRETQEPLPDEVASLMDAMGKSIDGENDRVYLVAQAPDDQVVGVVGFKNPDATMLSFAKTHNPAELINAYVAEDQRGGKGVGTALVRGLETEARSRGYTEIILNSGPRYKNTGWGFYDRLSGYERLGVAEKMYGEGGDAPVWGKALVL